MEDKRVNHMDAYNMIPAGVAHLLKSPGATVSLQGSLQNWN